MATCLDAGGGQYPDQVDGREIEPLMGRSLLPILRGDTRDPHPYLYFQFATNRGLRVGDWKIVSYRGGPWELFDLSTDRSETNNLVESQPQRAEAMRKQWKKIAEEVDRLPEKLRQPVKSKSEAGNLKFR